MQILNKEYDPELHDQFIALTVKNPYATLLTKPVYSYKGNRYAEKTIEVRSRNCHYRGDILICSSRNPIIPGYESGVTLGLVELYDVKPISEFTAKDWEQTRIPKDKQAQITMGYGWLMRNPRPVIEFPIKGQLGIYRITYTKDMIMEYPWFDVMTKEEYDLKLKR